MSELEMMENNEIEEINEDQVEVEGGSGKGIALVVGGLLEAGALGVAAFKKLKAKKADKPKKVKKKLRWVEVEEPEEVETEIEEADEADEVEEQD